MSIEIKNSSNEPDQNGTPGSTLPTSAITIGDKTYTPQEVEQVLQQRAEMARELEQFSVVKETIGKYGVDTNTFITNAEGAFSVMSRLIDEGIIDAQGSLTKKPGESSAATPPASGTTPPSSNSAGPAVDALASIGMLEEKVTKLLGLVEGLDKTQSSLIRSNLEKELTTRFPVLNKEDTSRVIAVALRDRSKDVFAHAEVLAKTRQEEQIALRLKFAEEFGVNLEEHDENKLLQSSPDKGAAALFNGKKFSFRKKEGSMSPLQATKKLFTLMK